MKILITGAGSYVGHKVAIHLTEKSSDWSVTELDLLSDEWRTHDFSTYDVVYHVAGIAHKRITKENEALYYSVNRDLAIEIAEKAKDSGVKQFIFMSSMSVYSDNTTYINYNTPTKPDNAYGNSKLQAEAGIMKLADESFIVSIVRPPMIYGKNCKGNYNKLRALALKLPMFPNVNNKRSMIFIDNFAEFIYQLIVSKTGGIFFPQNPSLANTSEWAKYIAEENGRRLHLSRTLGWCAIIGKHFPILSDYCNKAFGDSYYDLSMSSYDHMHYQIVDFRQSIHLTEV